MTGTCRLHHSLPCLLHPLGPGVSNSVGIGRDSAPDSYEYDGSEEESIHTGGIWTKYSLYQCLNTAKKVNIKFLTMCFERS